jgi:hypothetical protein
MRNFQKMRSYGKSAQLLQGGLEACADLNPTRGLEIPFPYDSGEPECWDVNFVAVYCLTH